MITVVAGALLLMSGACLLVLRMSWSEHDAADPPYGDAAGTSRQPSRWGLGSWLLTAYLGGLVAVAGWLLGWWEAIAGALT